MTAATWTVELAGNPPLSLNDRRHRLTHARLAAQWRRDTAYAVKTAQIPPQHAVTVVLHATPPTRRRRDTDNLTATLKPAVDALVDADIIEDDTPNHVTSSVQLHPASGDPLRRWQWTLEIRGHQ